MMPYEAVCGSGRKQIPFDKVPVEQAATYAAGCADVALRLHGVLKLALARERRTRVYETIERPLVAVLAAMERRGIRVDPAMLRQLSADFGARMAELEAEAYRLAGRAFNLGSPKQLGEILFDEQGLDSARKTRTGSHGTAADILEGPGGARPPAAPRRARLAPAAKAHRHLHRRPDPGDRARRPGAHLLCHGRDLDRAPVVERPEPAEHPDPHRGGAQDPPRVHRRGRPSAAVRRLFADRAARARPHGRDRRAQGGVRPRRRRARGDRIADVRRAHRGHGPAAAAQRQDDQLRHHLRHRRVRPRPAARHRVRRRAAATSRPISSSIPASATTWSAPRPRRARTAT